MGSSTGNSDTGAVDSTRGCSAYSSHDGDASTSGFARAAADDDDRKSETLLLWIAVATGRKADRARRNERATVDAFLAANMVWYGWWARWTAWKEKRAHQVEDFS